ncbi:MAG: hypothetical protein NT067_05615 [Candidatus Diapherotrites archaeon]|nr:hypothetical protein [Candidatus Diapherotrites archaeon]
MIRRNEDKHTVEVFEDPPEPRKSGVATVSVILPSNWERKRVYRKPLTSLAKKEIELGRKLFRLYQRDRALHHIIPKAERLLEDIREEKAGVWSRKPANKGRFSF